MKTKYLSQKLIEINLTHLKEYSVFVEGFLKEKQKQFTSWIEELTSTITEEDRKEELCDAYSDDYSEVYPGILRTSLFIACFSLLEGELTKLCKRLNKKSKFSLDINDLTGKGIERARVYLKKVAGIDFPDETNFWKDIIIYQKIRNSILHNDKKIVDKDMEDIKKYITRTHSIEIDDSGRVIFHDNFCSEVIGNVYDFFVALFSSLSKNGYEL